MAFKAARLWLALHLGGLTIRDAAVRIWRRSDEHAILTRAAAISFYAIAALVPFLALLITLTARWLPAIERAPAAVLAVEPIDPLGDLLPANAVSFIKHELDRLRQLPPSGLISFGLVALIWLSSSVFVEIIDAMNAIMGVEETRPFWRRRLLAIAMTMSEAAILIATTLTMIAWPQILDWLGFSPLVSILATAAHASTVSVMVFLCFALALQVGPNTDQHWKRTIPGSLLGAAVLLGVSILFRIYVQQWGHYSATYGSLAGIIGLMSWLWLCSVDLLVAAELNKVIEDASHLTMHDAQWHKSALATALVPSGLHPLVHTPPEHSRLRCGHARSQDADQNAAPDSEWI
jgi:membrane protein